MTAPDLFNPLTAPLTGVSLVEASAGTGKTWNIAALFVRLLIDESNGVPPLLEQILVVTYTKAATAELRTRLRSRLREALAALDQPGTDDWLESLLAPYRTDPVLLARTRLRLLAALSGFDAAAIHTIHGFCQRVLSDAAFESGQPFSAELVPDEDTTLRQLAEDFWRINIVYHPYYAPLVAAKKETPESWLNEVRPYLGKPYLSKTKPDTTQLVETIAARDTAWQVLCRAGTLASGIELFWSNFDSLKQNLYKVPTYQTLFEWLTTQVLTPNAAPDPDDGQCKALMRLTPDALSQGVKKGKTPPEHMLFVQIADWLTANTQLTEARQLQLAALKLQLIDWLDTESARQRHIHRQRRFDDLLSDLAAALTDARHGQALARHIADTWHVALIDEFQDTDPLQYAIFQHGFIEQDRPLFLVGDPKQAIYSFRGADIFAYLAAREDASQHYTLTDNHRSVTELVDSVNALFQRRQAFLLDIPYLPVRAAAERGQLQDTANLQPLVWQWGGTPEKAFNKADAEKQAAERTADSIAGLLLRAETGEACLVNGEDKRSLDGGDIAVLVASHRQGDLVRSALRERGVASVSLTQESVFASPEATELLILMRAWYEPGDSQLFRSAMATELIGLNAADLYVLENNAAEWERRQLALMSDRQVWLTQGFLAAWRQCFTREGMAERLLPLPDGERRLTNLTHLTELIQQTAEQKSGLAQLIVWMTECVAEPPNGEAALQRLESDASLVKIATIHAAKGLQYAVVYCPFLWDGHLLQKSPAFWRFHRDGVSHLVADAMVSGDQRESSENEQFAEKLRLLYVALTRAEHRLVIDWQPVSGMETAALSWLLHGQDCDSLEALKKQVKDKSPSEILADVYRLVSAQAPSMCLCTEPPPSARLSQRQHIQNELDVRTLTRRIVTPWRVTSFSALTPQHTFVDHEAPDYDNASIEPVAEVEPGFDRFSFPRGTRAGSCLHAIMENLNFTDGPDVHRQTIQTLLSRFGFDDIWLDAACELVQATLEAPLDDGIRLADIPPAQCLAEMQFNLPLAPLRAEALRELLMSEASNLHPACRAAAAALDFKTVSGFLKGFIDLIVQHNGRYYLIDYKSNHLGNSLNDYRPDALASAVADAHYYLQYLIYCVALRRYLTMRGIDYHACFGGVRYLFMRGLNGEGNGVWCDRPDEALLDGIERLFG